MIEYTFNSFDEFLAKVQEPDNPKGKFKQHASASEGRSHSWDLGAGWEGAIRMANEGWPEGLKKMQAMSSLLELPSGSRSYEPQPVLALAGDEVDIGLYLSGEPECMIDWETRETPSFGKVVTIYCHLTGNCNVSADALFRRGSVAYLIIDALESCGIRCEVWGLPKCSKKHRKRATTTDPDFLAKVLLKEADAPIEPDRMAYMLGHPAVFRRLGFRLWELDPQAKGQSYGYTVDPPASILDNEDVIFLGSAHTNYQTDTEVVEAAKQIAAKYITEDVAV